MQGVAGDNSSFRKGTSGLIGGWFSTFVFVYNEVEMFPSSKPIDSMVLTSSVEDNCKLKLVGELLLDIDAIDFSSPLQFPSESISIFSTLHGTEFNEGTESSNVFFFTVDDAIAEGATVFAMGTLEAAIADSEKGS